MDEGKCMTRKTTVDVFASILNFLPGGGAGLRGMGRLGYVTALYIFDRGSHQDVLLHRCMNRRHEEHYRDVEYSLTAVYTSEELSQKDFVLRMGCSIHDLMNAGHSGCEEEIERFQKTNTLKKANGVSKSLRDGLSYLIDSLHQVFKKSVTFLPESSFNREAVYGFLTLMRVPKETVVHIVNLNLQYHPAEECWSMSKEWEGSDFALSLAEMLIEDLMRLTTFSLSRWLSVASSGASFVVIQYLGLEKLVSHATARIPSASFPLQTHRKFASGNAVFRRFFMVVYMIFSPVNRAIARLLHDDRLIINHKEVKKEMVDSVNSAMCMRKDTWTLIEQYVGLGAEADIRDSVMLGLLKMRCYSERVLFSQFTTYPLKLASTPTKMGVEDAIRKSLDKLSTIPMDAEMQLDDTTAKVLYQFRCAKTMGSEKMLSELVECIKSWRQYNCSIRIIEQAHGAFANLKRRHSWNCLHLMTRGFGTNFQAVMNKFDEKIQKTLENVEEARIQNKLKRPTEFREVHQLKNELALARTEAGEKLNFKDHQKLQQEARARIQLMTEEAFKKLKKRRDETVGQLLQEQVDRSVQLVSKKAELRAKVVEDRSSFSPIDPESDGCIRLSMINLPKRQLLRFLADNWSTMTHEQASTQQYYQKIHPPTASALRLMKEVSGADVIEVRRAPAFLEDYWRDCPTKSALLVTNQEAETRVFIRGERLGKRALSFIELSPAKVPGDSFLSWVKVDNRWARNVNLLKMRDAPNTYDITEKVHTESSLAFRNITTIEVATPTCCGGRIVLVDHEIWPTAIDDLGIDNSVKSLEDKVDLPTKNLPADLLWDSENPLFKDIIDSQEAESQGKRKLAAHQPLSTLVRINEKAEKGTRDGEITDDAPGDAMLNRFSSTSALVRQMKDPSFADAFRNPDSDVRVALQSTVPKNLTATEVAARAEALSEIAAQRQQSRQETGAGEFRVEPRGVSSSSNAAADKRFDYHVLSRSSSGSSFLKSLDKAEKPKFTAGKARTSHQAKLLANEYRRVVDYLYSSYHRLDHLEGKVPTLPTDEDLQREMDSNPNMKDSAEKRVGRLYDRFEALVKNSRWDQADGDVRGL